MKIFEAQEELREKHPSIAWVEFNRLIVSLDGGYTVEELEDILRLAKLLKETTE